MLPALSGPPAWPVQSSSAAVSLSAAVKLVTARPAWSGSTADAAWGLPLGCLADQQFPAGGLHRQHFDHQPRLVYPEWQEQSAQAPWKDEGANLMTNHSLTRFNGDVADVSVSDRNHARDHRFPQVRSPDLLRLSMNGQEGLKEIAVKESGKGRTRTPCAPHACQRNHRNWATGRRSTARNLLPANCNFLQRISTTTQLRFRAVP